MPQLFLKGFQRCTWFHRCERARAGFYEVRYLITVDTDYYWGVFRAQTGTGFTVVRAWCPPIPGPGNAGAMSIQSELFGNNHAGKWARFVDQWQVRKVCVWLNELDELHYGPLAPNVYAASGQEELIYWGEHGQACDEIGVVIS